MVDNDQMTARTFPARPESMAQVRLFVKELAAQAEFPQAATDDLLLAVTEASANCVRHSGCPELRVVWIARGSCVDVVVADEGVFNRSLSRGHLDGAGGFGIPLMLSLMDEVSVREGTEDRPGTSVRLHRCRGERHPVSHA
ncbi:MAG: ATP-binding protein [Actinomycetota bacterium]|nr:ATP-binding protein [Actinomycetota bacterium]